MNPDSLDFDMFVITAAYGLGVSPLAVDWMVHRVRVGYTTLR